MSTATRFQCAGNSPMRRERGLVLIIALIVLVAMTLASLAMIRSVDTSTIIAGNIAFKQSAVASADAGIESAIAWITSNVGATLEKDSTSNGYYATSQDGLDLTGLTTSGNATDDLDWSSSSTVKKLAADAARNEVAYVIHRMCNSAGQLNATTCATDESVQGGGSMGSSRQMTTYQPGSWSSVANRAYYRITVRVTGPRNTVNFVQAIVSQ
jgi:type IV pilus assembly protein PilX